MTLPLKKMSNSTVYLLSLVFALHNPLEAN